MVAAVGITERGPVGQAILETSFEELVDTFGGFTPNSDLALAASAFFENGGQVLYVVRTVHYGSTTDATTKTSTAATLALSDGSGGVISTVVSAGQQEAAATVKPLAAGAGATLRIDGKSDEAYANDLQIVIAAATSGAPGEFNLSVEDNGLVTETFPNLSMDPTQPSYVETIVNDLGTGSELIVVTDLGSASASPANLPALGTFGPLIGGDDGLANLADVDFIGDPAGKTGLHALDAIQGITLLIVPGRATAAVHNAMLTYGEVTRDHGCFAILDPPANQSATDIISYASSTAAILGLSEFGALYWPRVKVVNPSTTVFGTAVPARHLRHS